MAKLKRIMGFIGLCCLLASMWAAPAFAGTTLKINNASTNLADESLVIDGLNFPVDGSLEVWIGDSLLSACSVTQTTVSCSLTGTPALNGGTWTVRLSAGNSPNTNDEIDVYVQAGAMGCTMGDWVSCYAGERSEIGVGICRSGTRICGSSGSFGTCEGETTPLSEWPDLCGNGIDDDCDGIVDNGCDRLVDNPTIFTGRGSFTIPAGVTAIRIEAIGGGGGGGGAQLVYPDEYASGSLTAQAGGGGGSGGRSVIESLPVSEGEQFSVTVGQGGQGGAASQRGYSGTDSVVSRVAGTTEIIVSAQGGTGGNVGTAGSGGSGNDANGNSGTPGQTCVAEWRLAEGYIEEMAIGGYGGPGLSGAGQGGSGQSNMCFADCRFEIISAICTLGTQPQGEGIAAEKGLVRVSW